MPPPCGGSVERALEIQSLLFHERACVLRTAESEVQGEQGVVQEGALQVNVDRVLQTICGRPFPSEESACEFQVFRGSTQTPLRDVYETDQAVEPSIRWLLPEQVVQSPDRRGDVPRGEGTEGRQALSAPGAVRIIELAVDEVAFDRVHHATILACREHPFERSRRNPRPAEIAAHSLVGQHSSYQSTMRVQ